MRQDKKFLIPFVLESILPWIIMIPGIFSICLFHQADQNYRAHMLDAYEKSRLWFECSFKLSMGIGIGSLVCIFVIGLSAFISMIVYVITDKQDKKYKVKRSVILWVWSILCFIGAIIQCLIIGIFTYGMGV